MNYCSLLKWQAWKQHFFLHTASELCKNKCRPGELDTEDMFLLTRVKTEEWLVCRGARTVEMQPGRHSGNLDDEIALDQWAGHPSVREHVSIDWTRRVVSLILR